MPRYSILIACDQKYYEDWGVNLLKSTHFHNPWLTLRCHIVNPGKFNKLDFVEYTTEDLLFENETSRISYLQSARFIAVSKISTTEFVLTLDCDTICTRSFTRTDFLKLFEKQYVLQHPKDFRWLAGLVAFSNNNFRIAYANRLNELPTSQWEWGRDQNILAVLSNEYNFEPVNKSWMAIGKNKNDSAFLTLKGDQKVTYKYLKIYNNYLRE